MCSASHPSVVPGNVRGDAKGETFLAKQSVATRPDACLCKRHDNSRLLLRHGSRFEFLNRIRPFIWRVSSSELRIGMRGFGSGLLGDLGRALFP
jgi:hypothetical protein